MILVSGGSVMIVDAVVVVLLYELSSTKLPD